jgi:hypothetical protein
LINQEISMALLATNKKYQAELRLSSLEAMMASNDMIAGKFRTVGFTGVVVTGSGVNRSATGVWSGATKDVQLPSQVKSYKQV